MAHTTAPVRAPAEVADRPDLIPTRKMVRRSSLELLGNLTLREIRSQYKRTALGRLWSFINPLATIAIFSLVFGLIFEMKIAPSRYSGVHVFALWLAAALLAWNFISGAVMGGMNALLNSASLLSKVYFPRWIPVVATVLAMAVTFATELAVLLVIMAVWGGPKVLLMIPLLIVLTIIVMAFVTGIALSLSIAVVYFRDTQHFMALFIQIWFYLTPIIYPIDTVAHLQERLGASGHPFPLGTVWGLNPAFRFTNAFRSMLYDFEAPKWEDWVGSILWAAAALAVGTLIFRKFSRRVVEEL